MKMRLKKNVGEHTDAEGNVYKAGDIIDFGNKKGPPVAFEDKFEPLMQRVEDDPAPLQAEVDNNPTPAPGEFSAPVDPNKKPDVAQDPADRQSNNPQVPAPAPAPKK